MRKITEHDRLTVAEAARLLDLHPSTLWRWASRGIGGQRLPMLRLGGRRIILRRDLDNFLARLNADGPEHTTQDVSADRQRQIQAAEARLKAAGIL